MDVNPFHGPGPLTENDEIFGRDSELRALSSLLTAQRVVLLYSPSGAGKSSLLNARNGLLSDACMKGSLAVFPVARVNQEPSGKVRNRFVWSAIGDFEKASPEPLSDEKRREMKLQEYVQLRIPSSPTLLVFDQFEEVLRTDPTDREAKRVFFDELGEMLLAKHIWALFSMREDYLAPLDRYRRLVPTRLENRFRLDLLSTENAKAAISRTADAAGSREIEPAALDELVASLAANPDEPGDSAGYVEPLLLQVLCRDLWTPQRDNEGNPLADHSKIMVADVEALKRKKPLVAYYDQAVRDAVTQKGVAKPLREEFRLRFWIENRLIGKSGARVQAPESEAEAEANPKCLEAIEHSHILRRESHGGGYLELSHDRLVAPVRESNSERRKTPAAYLYDPVRRRQLLWAAFFAAVVSLIIFSVYRHVDRMNYEAAIDKKHDAHLIDAALAVNNLEDAKSDGSPQGLIDSAGSALEALDEDRSPDASALMVLHTAVNDLGTIQAECNVQDLEPLTPALSRDGKTMYVADLNAAVVRICPPVGVRDLSEAGKVVDFGEGDIINLTVGTKLIAALISDGSDDPDNPNYKIGLARLGDTKPWPYLPAPHGATHVVLSEDEKWIAAYGSKGAKVYRIDPEKVTAVPLGLDGDVTALFIGHNWLIAAQGRSISLFNLNGPQGIPVQRGLPQTIPPPTIPPATSDDGAAKPGTVPPPILSIDVRTDGNEAVASSGGPEGKIFRLALPSGKWREEKPRRFFDKVPLIRYEEGKNGNIVFLIRRANALPALVSSNGQTVFPFPGDYYPPAEAALRHDELTISAFSPDGRSAMVGTRSSILLMTRGNKEVLPSWPAFPCDSFKSKPDCPEPESRRMIDRCHLSADGLTGLCMVGTHLESLRDLRQIANKAMLETPVDADTDDFALSPDGQFALVVNEGKMWRFDLKSGSAPVDAPVDMGSPPQSGFPRDHEYSIDNRGRVLLFDDYRDNLGFVVLQSDGKRRPPIGIGPSDDVSLSMDGAGQVAVIGLTRSLKRLDLTHPNSQPEDLAGGALSGQIVKVSPDGDRVALAREDGRVHILDLKNNACKSAANKTGDGFTGSLWNYFFPQAEDTVSGTLCDDFSIPLTLGERLEDVGFDGTQLVGLVRDWSGQRRLTRTEMDQDTLKRQVCGLIAGARLKKEVKELCTQILKSGDGRQKRG